MPASKEAEKEEVAQKQERPKRKPEDSGIVFKCPTRHPIGWTLGNVAYPYRPVMQYWK